MRGKCLPMRTKRMEGNDRWIKAMWYAVGRGLQWLLRDRHQCQPHPGATQKSKHSQTSCWTYQIINCSENSPGTVWQAFQGLECTFIFKRRSELGHEHTQAQERKKQITAKPLPLSSTIKPEPGRLQGHFQTDADGSANYQQPEQGWEEI